MDDNALQFWCQVEYWYAVEAALILSGVDPRNHGPSRMSRRCLREQYPEAAGVLLILQRSSLVGSRRDYQPNLKYLAAADRAGVLTNERLRQHLQQAKEGLVQLQSRDSLVQQVHIGDGALTQDRRVSRKHEYEWDNLQKFVALLLAAFLCARDSKLLGQIHNPNVSQIVSELLKFADSIGLDSVGIGRTSMTEKINEAVARFRDNRIVGNSS